MGKIKQLDQTLSNIIAAGEVIENPSNIVKELVENSIDARASNIKLYLTEAGITNIKITDDGEGMDLEDLRLCFYPHATSKISNEYDLVRVKTLGFRGEAIASIASVSIMSITSKTKDSQFGHKITYRFGKFVSEEVVSCNKGTTIEVSNLFYNTPVRLKYLRSVDREKASILYLIGKLALTHTNISFYLECDDKELFDYRAKDGFKMLIKNLYGTDAANNLVNIKKEEGSIALDIYYIKPSIYRSNKLHMTYIINDRYIKDHRLNEAVIDAFDTFLPISKYPIVILYVKIDPLLIDVNVHPKKSEIRIADEDILCKLITNTLKSSLQSNNQIRNERLNKQSDFEIFKNHFNNELKDSAINLNITDIFNSKIDNNESNINVEQKEGIKQIKKLPNLFYIGIFNKTYILFENDSDLYLVDQHAAAERINYEYYYDLLNNSTACTELLFPLGIHFTNDEAIYINNNLDKLKEIGFTLEALSNNDYSIRTVPLWAKDRDFNDIIYSMLDMFIKNKEISIIKFRDQICKQISCKSSIKANDVISKEEAISLIEQLNHCQNPYNCPHGRPTIIKFSNYEIKKMFERIQS